MKWGWRIWRQAGGVVGFAAVILASGLLAPRLRADEAGQPKRAVRLASVEGKVRVSQGNQALADPALANMPLFEGSEVATAEDGRAEIQFEDGSVARLSPNSSLILSVLRGPEGPSESEMVLESGLGYFELQAVNGTAQVRIRFADSVVTASGFTVLRVNLDNPPGELAVFSGNAHIERGSALALDLHGGESVALNGADPSHYNLSESIEPDSWDAWNADRDQALQAEYGSQTGATKSFDDSNNPAWADLDSSGNWYNVPDQGYVWSPYEASNSAWDPYGNGSWMWSPGYDYFWVSGDPWGYMPYQCGLWNYYDSFGWGWAPGRCRPWWGIGGWIPNIGYGPGGYRPPRRPLPGPRGPINHPVVAGTRAPLHPVIPVSRRLSGVTATLPDRARNVSVTIAGHAVQPIHPDAPRPAYDRSASSFANRSQPTNIGGTRVLGMTGQPSTSGYGLIRPANPSGPRPSSPRPSGSSSRPAPASHPSSSGSSVSHSSGSSGGGGGTSHGGGGGGGGGSHR